jgi:hypothetical protein
MMQPENEHVLIAIPSVPLRTHTYRTAIEPMASQSFVADDKRERRKLTDAFQSAGSFV